MYFGWPKIRLSELPEYQKRLSGGGLIFSYVLLLIGSSFFYILVLRGKGQLGINHVSASSAMVNDNVFESNKTTSIIQLSSQEEEELQKMENERLYAEINAAYKSLVTNILLSLFFIGLYISFYLLSEDFLAIIFVVSKSFASIATTVVNFGPIKNQLKNLIHSVRTCFN